MGASVPRAVAQGACEHAGWDLGWPRARHPAGGCRQPCAGESLSSLCVRSLDAKGVSGRPVRTICRRRYRSEAQALELRQALEQRFAECRLRLHPQKTKIVYCKDANRPGEYPDRSFDFLGYTFRPRMAKNRDGKRFVGFIPAVSKTAGKRMRQSVRRWRLHCRNDLALEGNR